MREGVGVCRDFAHLAAALCRYMNIPTRYCTGYLGDIGVPVDPNPMDFSAWFEVFLDGRWYTMDARHNHPRIGRIVMGRGRDAADVAISTSFGVAKLARFEIVTEHAQNHQCACSLLTPGPFRLGYTPVIVSPIHACPTEFTFMCFPSRTVASESRRRWAPSAARLAIAGL
jgi:hypothetical protein